MLCWSGRGPRCDRGGRTDTPIRVPGRHLCPLPTPRLSSTHTQGATLDPRLAFRGRTLTVDPAGGPLPAGTPFLSVPRPAMVTRDTLPSDPQYGPAWRTVSTSLAAGDDPDGPLDGRDAVCVALLVERARGAASIRAPYIGALPAAYDDPTWWSEADVALLAGSRLGASAAAARAAVGRLARVAARVAAAATEAGVPDGGPLATFNGGWCVSEEGARWARSTVWSRAFNLPTRADEDTPAHAAAAAALVPVADMMDHSPVAGMAWSVEGGGGGGGDDTTRLTYRTLTPVAPAAPLLSNYSHRKSDEELIAGYGFALESNPSNFFHFSIALGGSGSAARRAARRARRALGPSAADAYCTTATPLPRTAQAAVALALVEGSAACELECVEEAGGGESGVGVRAGDRPDAPPTVTSLPRPPPGEPAPPPGTDWGLPMPPSTALAAAAALRRALRGRAAALAGGPPSDDEAAAAVDGVHRHTAMALTYRANQKRLALGAQEALAGAASAVVAALSQAVCETGLAPATEAPADDAPLLIEIGVPSSPCAGARCAATQPWRAWEWGACVGPRGARAGEVLAVIPPTDVWVVPADDADGVEDAVLAAAAAAGVFEEVEEGAEVDASASASIVRHLATTVAPPPAARLLLTTTGVGPAVAAALQDTPAGDEAAAAAADAVAAAGGNVPTARARAWAAAVVDRGALDGPSPGNVAFARLTSAVPPCVRGVAVDISWRPDGSAALTAAANLPPGTVLTPALAMLGEDAGSVMAEAGPEGVAALAVATATLPRGLGGGTLLRHTVAVDPSAAAQTGTAASLLKAACLDGPHWVTTWGAATARAGVAAAVAAAPRADLKAANAKRANAARKAANDAAAAAVAAGGAGREAAAAAAADADALTAAAAAAVAASPGGRAGVAELRDALLASADAWGEEEEGGGGGDSVIIEGCRAYRRGVAAVAVAAARALAVRPRSEE